MLSMNRLAETLALQLNGYSLLTEGSFTIYVLTALGIEPLFEHSAAGGCEWRKPGSDFSSENAQITMLLIRNNDMQKLGHSSFT